MAKRGALTEMNHDNWDQEEESEEAGQFRQASQNVIKGRVIRKAKRKGVAEQTDQSEEGKPSAFKGFSGFVSSNAKPSFSFNKDSSKPLGGFANGGAAPSFSLGGASVFGNLKPAAPTVSSQPKSEEKAPESTASTTVNGSSSSNRSKYLQQLRALNESVSKWIAEHVSKNAHCVLTPIFKDYEKHLAEVEKLNPDNQAKYSDDASGSTSKTASAETGEKQIDMKKKSPMKAETETKPAFTFGSSSSTAAASEDKKPSIFGSDKPSIFGSSTSSSTFGSASGFSFKPSEGGSGGLKPFSFASSSDTPSTSSGAKAEEDEEYEPPKVESNEIKEEDAFYTKKCKLFYQKSGAWTERGVGFIHLKPCGEKTQLLIRADTSLGNILLNIMVSASIPLARQGKNNVSMLCMANPLIDPKETDPKPTSFLIRVKNADDADELLEELKKAQK